MFHWLTFWNWSSHSILVFMLSAGIIGAVLSFFDS